MTTALAEPLMTIEEFSRHPDRDHTELLDGVLVERPMGAKSGLIIANWLALIGQYLRGRRLGACCSSDTGYILWPNNQRRLRFPDASFVAAARLPDGKVPEGYFHLAPDFAVEVVSPNDGGCEIQEKVEEYLAAGTRVVAVIYPRAEVVLLFHADGLVLKFTSSMALEIPELFPGFQCPVSELFTID